MRGSVHRHGPSWSYRLELGTDHATGARRRLRRSGFRTRKAAEQALAEALSAAHRGELVRPAQGTLADYMAGWLDKRRADLRPTTHYEYAKAANQHILPGLGHVRLSDLDAATLEAWYARLLAGGGAAGRPLSAKTVRNCAGVLSVALSDAVRLRLIRHNPSSDARLPRGAQPEMAAWDEGEAARFLAGVTGDRWHPMWRLVLATGLRRGELCGLRWRDLDLEAGRLEVVQARVVAGQVMVGAPKTRTGARRVALDAETVAALVAWRRQIATERLAAGPAWQDHGLVFVDELGQPPHPETVTRRWGEACRRAGVRPIRLHDARHTAATLALRAGVPVTVLAQRLGHAHVSVTLGIYAHVTAQDDRAAAEAMGRALGSK